MQGFAPIKYKNFKPTKVFEGIVLGILDRIYMSAPGATQVTFDIERIDNTYRGSGTVMNPRGVCVGYSSNKNLIYLVNEIEAQLYKQLSEYKRGRRESFYNKVS